MRSVLGGVRKRKQNYAGDRHNFQMYEIYKNSIEENLKIAR